MVELTNHKVITKNVCNCVIFSHLQKSLYEAQNGTACCKLAKLAENENSANLYCIFAL
jgi:hypothetical protein